MSTKPTDNEPYEAEIVVQATPVPTPTFNDEGKQYRWFTAIADGVYGI